MDFKLFFGRHEFVDCRAVADPVVQPVGPLALFVLVLVLVEFFASVTRNMPWSGCLYFTSSVCATAPVILGFCPFESHVVFVRARKCI